MAERKAEQILEDRIGSLDLPGGAPLSGADTAVLAVESMMSDWRFLFHEAEYEAAALPTRADSVLLICLSNMGDVICASAVFDGVRAKYPDARIVFLTEKPGGGLYEHSPVINRVIEYSPSDILKDFKNEPSPETLEAACARFTKLVDSLRAEKFDLVLNLHLSARSAIIAGAAVEDRAARFGFGLGGDARPVIRGNIWMQERLMGKIPAMRMPEEICIRSLGLAPPERKTGVHVPAEAGPDWPIVNLPPRGRTVGINPFASVEGREWGDERFIRLCRILAQEMDCGLMMFAGPSAGEQERAERICGEAGADVMRCYGGPPDRTAWHARRCDLFVTNDTGPMHIAGAVGTRCLVMHGPTNILPYSSAGHIGIAAALPCAGCRPLPDCKDRKCFELIEPEQAAHVAAVMLEEGPHGALAKLAGHIEDGVFPHGLITTGVYESLTPRYLIRLRSAMPAESSVVSELARIAMFKALSLIEGGALESGRHPLGTDHPGLAAPFSPDVAMREVLKRHDFAEIDAGVVKASLEELLGLWDADVRELRPETIVLLLPALAFRQFAAKAGLSGNISRRVEAVCKIFVSDVIKSIC